MWHKLDIKEVYAKLSTSESGLSDKEAQLRLERYGYNELKEKKKVTSLQLFINQFKNFLIFILIIAMLVSLFLGEIIDAAAIGTILMLNAFFGFYQERKAEHALEALKKIAAPKAKVVRAGQTRFLPARELVPGDVILLETGDKVPADARIFEELNLKIDEAVLTGESVAVKKTSVKVSKDAIPERKNITFSGTIVVYGYCRAIVVATGMETEFGKIAKVLQEKEETTPLQKRLEHLGRQLGVAVLAITAIIFVAGYLHGIELVEMFLVSVSLAVAAIPEGLPAVVTITLSIGLLRLARKNAIIRKLSAAEALGSTTVICTDKTGTLTVNQMTVRKMYVDGNVIEVTGQGYELNGKFLLDKKDTMNESIKALLKIGNLCNNAVLDKEQVGDPTEIALLVSARKSGMKDLRKEYKKLDEVPFESERKMMSVLFEGDGKTMYTKGAVEEVLKRCEFVYKNGKKERMSTKDRKDIIDMNHEFASSSLRVLAFAIKDASKSRFEENDLMFVGLQGMIDPPRPEVKEAISKCKDAGIKVVMVTGDHKDTAVTIAREIGILDKGKVLTGEELEKINEKEFLAIVEDVSVYARVSPEHKVKITVALKKKGHIVAMTGDGINDAPALKKSDVGIAMGITGTDVSKEASDMILTDDNFATIVAAVEEGRNIYDNIKKFVIYLISANMGEILTIFTAIMINLPLPLLPLQILWMNLITDGLPALALGVEPAEPDIMKRKPNDPKEKMLNRKTFVYVLAVGFIYVIGTLGLFYLELANGEAKARTVAFTTLIMFEMFHALAIRSYSLIYKIGFFSNKKLLLAIASSVVLQAMVIYIPFLNTIFDTTPLTAVDWIRITAVSSTIFFILEAKKLIRPENK